MSAAAVRPIAPTLPTRMKLSIQPASGNGGVTLHSFDSKHETTRTIGLPWSLILPLADALVDAHEQHEARRPKAQT